MKWNDFQYDKSESTDYVVPFGGEPFGTGAPIEYEMRIKNRKGDPRDIVVTTSPIPQTSRYVTSILDITRRKQSEDELRASLKEKEVLLKEVHHRVKNNLQTIASLLRLQARRSGSDEVRRALAEAVERAAAMAGFFGGQPRAGGTEAGSAAPVDLPKLVAPPPAPGPATPVKKKKKEGC